MYTEEMLESIKKVEAKRAENAAMEPKRMTAEEKDQVLRENHPDYRQDQFDVLTVGPNKGEKAPKELVKMLGEWGKIPVTYAGGVGSFEDLLELKKLGNNRLNVTIGSALDLFGGPMAYDKVLQYMKKE